jgi:hypothetical protein
MAINIAHMARSIFEDINYFLYFGKNWKKVSEGI